MFNDLAQEAPLEFKLSISPCEPLLTKDKGGEM
jgi:hypothetical protein